MPSVSTLINPVLFGVPLIVTVFAAPSVTTSAIGSIPLGKFTSLIPVAEPPHLKVIGSMGSPTQTVCSSAGAVVWTNVGCALIVIVVTAENASSHSNSPASNISLLFWSLYLVVWSL